METTATRCAIYLRISLDPTGEQLAVQRQREDCLKIAAARGWQVIEPHYTDNSVSAWDKRKKRPGYDAMVAGYRDGKFDAIVVWDLDRLTRQPRQLEDWIDAAEERGLKLVTANGEADLSTDAGRLFARIKAGVARSESDRKAARQARALRQRAEAGNAPLGVRLTGYTTSGALAPADRCDVATRREISETGLIREIFDRFHSGDSLKGIATWWKNSPYPTRHGRDPSPSSIRDILTNPRYAGRVIYNRHAAKGTGPSAAATFPPLIGEAVFDAVQHKLADPRRRKQVGTDRKHLGSGLYLCGVCDRPVRSHGTPHRYRCPQGHVTRTADLVDEYVLALIREQLSRPGLATLLAVPAGKEAQDLTAVIETLRGRLERTKADYDTDLIDGERYRVKTAKLTAELGTAETARVRLLAGSEVAGTLTAPDPVAAFDAAPLGVQRAVIGFFVTVRLDPAPRGRRGFDPRTVPTARKHRG